LFFDPQLDSKLVENYYQNLIHWTGIDENEYSLESFRQECDILLMRGLLNNLKKLSIDGAPEKTKKKMVGSPILEKASQLEKVVLENKVARLVDMVNRWQKEDLFKKIFEQ